MEGPVVLLSRDDGGEVGAWPGTAAFEFLWGDDVFRGSCFCHAEGLEAVSLA